MTRLPHSLRVLVAVALGVAALAAGPASTAGAQSYSDVPTDYWARTAIDWVTDQGPVDDRVLDDYVVRFRPDRLIRRRQLARALVVASGHQNDVVTDPVLLADVVPDIDPYYWDIQIAIKLGLMSPTLGLFNPEATVPAAKAERAVIRTLKLLHPEANWTLLTTLRPAVWRPNPDWNTRAPSLLPWIVASRHLLLRYNHPYPSGEVRERSPGEAVSRAEIAYMLWKGLPVESWRLGGLQDYSAITFPLLSYRQRQVTKFALKYIGYPYVYGGEWPTADSPYGYQAHGGFDCSGFVWWVLKVRFGYPIYERGASDMARSASPRITRSGLKCGDIIFFGPDGTASKVSSIYHAGIYLGRGWFIHSTGSSAGVMLASLNTSVYWGDHFAWGRRVLTPAQLIVL
jgi:hypothetical protein